MRLLREEINSLSKEASLFIQDNPEYKDQIVAFENEFDVKDSLKTSIELASFLNDFVSLRNEFDETDYPVEVFEWSIPTIENINYTTIEDNLAIEAKLEWTGDAIVYKEEDTVETTVYASVYVYITIPKDVSNYNEYIPEDITDEDISYDF